MTANVDGSLTGQGHDLICPACRIELSMSERQGIEIDYCPKCRGVWLDRGELDKIIQQSANDERRAAPPAPTQHEPYRGDRHYEGGHGAERGSHGMGYSRSRKKSFLSELFD